MAECGISGHTHDPGVVLTHSTVAMTDGAGCLADLAALREHDELFGQVASIVTAWRAVEATAAPGLGAIPPAVAAARAKVWTAPPPGLGWETTNEPLAAMLRPGNAESNEADHHLELLDRAIDGLPAVYQADHDVRTTLVRSSTRSWCVPSRPGPPTSSSWSSSRPTATTPSATRKMGGSGTPSSSSKKRTGARRSRPTAASGTVRGWSS